MRICARVLTSDELVYAHKKQLTAKIVRRLAKASRKGAKAQSSYLSPAEKP